MQSIKKLNFKSGVKKVIPYWWNMQTMEVRKHPPPTSERSEMYPYAPKMLQKLQLLISSNPQPKTLPEALELLGQVRSLLLNVPVPSADIVGSLKSLILEDELQKAIDVLTLLLHTKCFFTIMEPEEMGSISASSGDPDGTGETCRSSVISSLLSWLDQQDDRLEISNLVGTALLPTIESCFYMKPALDTKFYVRGPRLALLQQLCHEEERYSVWRPEVVSCFKNAVQPKLASDLVSTTRTFFKTTTWPPATPPPRLFGSPVIDAAFLDNLELTRLSAKLSGEYQDVLSKSVLESLSKPASHRSKLLFSDLVEDIKSYTRSKVTADYLDPPKLPASMLHDELRTSWVTPPKLESESFTQAPRMEISAQVWSIVNQKNPIKEMLNGLVSQVEQEHQKVIIQLRKYFTNFFEYCSLKFDYDYFQTKSLWRKMTYKQKLSWGEYGYSYSDWAKSDLFAGVRVSTFVSDAMIVDHTEDTNRYYLACSLDQIPAPKLKGLKVVTGYGSGEVSEVSNETLEVRLKYGKLYLGPDHQKSLIIYCPLIHSMNSWLAQVRFHDEVWPGSRKIYRKRKARSGSTASTSTEPQRGTHASTQSQQLSSLMARVELNRGAKRIKINSVVETIMFELIAKVLKTNKLPKLYEEQ